ncbi:Na/Pi cotransporter family protein [Persicobacter psychrovividus]|uniref:PhoU domain-containing protein n=1 Tax=Persicobacter psychrovividus TaxID=387638 RepID=A0ABM7VH77_9BACT|nr:hypothetical protein PEPS_26180 [Persicobacter psychrovividus]
MEYGIIDFLELIGALGFFIYGMKVMSEGIQKVAGNKMREVLGKMTQNRFMGMMTGFVTTSLVQSSSATTVMVVSFVNAGLLSLVQAVSVIMGANIGTTMTGVLLTVFGFSKVSISAYALVIIALGFPMLFMSNNKAKSLGEFLIGFALLFMGLDALKGAVPDLKANPEILSFVKGLTGIGPGGIISTIIFIGLGTLLTIIVQSSSAAMAITLVLCNKGLIPFEAAAAIILGENIGTTVTANLAAMIANVHAKRAAFAHFIFNIFGVVWMLIVFHYFTMGIGYTMDHFLGLGDPFTEVESIKWGLTLFHITFNLINTFVMIWFVNFIADTVTRLLPAKEEDNDDFRLEYITTGLMSTPESSILSAQQEAVRFAEYTEKMLNNLRKLIEEEKPKKQKKFIDKIRKYESTTDEIHEEIAKYLLKISANDLSKNSIEVISDLHYVINDLERIGDVFSHAAKVFTKKNEQELLFTSKQKQSLIDLSDKLKEGFKIMKENLQVANNPTRVDFEKASNAQRSVYLGVKQLNKKLLTASEAENYDIKSGILYSDLVMVYSRVNDHVFNISRDVIGHNR